MNNFMPITTDHSFLPFQYEGMRLQEACFINGNPYFTAKAIGEFLEYKHKRPELPIHKIVARNPHILEFSGVPRLGTPGGIQEVRVFNPIGLQLIIFESHQPKAIQYKVAVAHLVLAFMQGQIKPKVWGADRMSAIKQILSAPPTYGRSSLVKDLAAREGRSKQQVYRWLSKFGGIKTKKGIKRCRAIAA